MICPKCKMNVNFMKVDTFFLALLEIINNLTKVIDRVDFYLEDKIILHTEDDQ